jgi:general secretion pathway protein L
MADTVFCLEIADDVVTGVLVAKRAKATVVVGCAQAEIHKIPLEDGVVQVCQQAGFSGGACHLALGAEFFSFRNLSFPFSDRKKITQTLPFELENLSASEGDDLLADFLISGTGPEGAQIVAATIEKEVLTDLLQALDKADVDPDTIEVAGVRIALRLADALAEDCVLLDIRDSLAELIIVSRGGIVLIRSLQLDPKARENGRQFEELGRLVRQTLLVSRIVDLEKKEFTLCLIGDETEHAELAPQLSSQLGVKVRNYQLSDQSLIKIDSSVVRAYRFRQMDLVLALALKLKAKNGTFNFRKDEFKKRKSTPELRTIFLRAGVPLAVTIALIVFYFGYDYKKLRDRHDATRQQVVQVFNETLPEVKRIVNPVQQLQVRINEIRKTYSGRESGTGHTVIALLTEISARIPTSYHVVVKRMVADSDVVRIKAVTKDFNTVDNVQKELEKSSYFQSVTISAANQSPKKEEVSFELKLELL